MALSFCFFLVEGYLLPLIVKLISKWKILNFGIQFRSICRTLSNTQDGGFCKNSEPLFTFGYFYQSSTLDDWQILSLPLKPVTTCRKSSISDVWQGFKFTFALIFFHKTIAYLFTEFDIWLTYYTIQYNTNQAIQYCARSNPRDLMFNIICLITKVIIVFPTETPRGVWIWTFEFLVY